MGNIVGIEDIGTPRSERRRDFRLAAADTARKSDEVRAPALTRHKYQPLISPGPKNNATPPAIARYGPNASGTL